MTALVKNQHIAFCSGGGVSVTFSDAEEALIQTVAKRRGITVEAVIAREINNLVGRGASLEDATSRATKKLLRSRKEKGA